MHVTLIGVSKFMDVICSESTVMEVLIGQSLLSHSETDSKSSSFSSDTFSRATVYSISSFSRKSTSCSRTFHDNKALFLSAPLDFERSVHFRF